MIALAAGAMMVMRASGVAAGWRIAATGKLGTRGIAPVVGIAWCGAGRDQSGDPVDRDHVWSPSAGEPVGAPRDATGQAHAQCLVV